MFKINVISARNYPTTVFQSKCFAKFPTIFIIFVQKFSTTKKTIKCSTDQPGQEFYRMQRRRFAQSRSTGYYVYPGYGRPRICRTNHYSGSTQFW